MFQTHAFQNTHFHDFYQKTSFLKPQKLKKRQKALFPQRLNWGKVVRSPASPWVKVKVPRPKNWWTSPPRRRQQRPRNKRFVSTWLMFFWYNFECFDFDVVFDSYIHRFFLTVFLCLLYGWTAMIFWMGIINYLSYKGLKGVGRRGLQRIFGYHPSLFSFPLLSFSLYVPSDASIFTGWRLGAAAELSPGNQLDASFGTTAGWESWFWREQPFLR